MTIEGRIRAALHAEAEAYRVDEHDWSALERGVHRRRRRQRSGLAIGAAMIATAGVLSVLVIGDGDRDETRTADPPASMTSQPEATSPPGSPEAPTTLPSAVSPPTVAAAVRSDGRLVVVDPETGQEVREIAYEGSRTDELREVPSTFIESVAVAPDGKTIYYTRCCEPAIGSVLAVPTTGGEATLLADGSPVAVGPGGQVAVVDQAIGVKIYGELTEAPSIIPIEPRDDDGDTVYDPEIAVDVAWDSSGRHLVVGLDHGAIAPRVALVTLAGDGEPASEILTPGPGVAWSHPRFGPGGLIYVIESRDGEASVVRIIDRDGADRGALDLDGAAPRSIGSDITATWLLVGLEGGGLVIIDSDGQAGPVRGDGEYVSIDW